MESSTENKVSTLPEDDYKVLEAEPIAIESVGKTFDPNRDVDVPLTTDGKKVCSTCGKRYKYSHTCHIHRRLYYSKSVAP